MIFSSSRSLPFCYIRCLSVVQVTAFLLFAAFPLSRSPPFCYIRCLSVEHLLPFRCTYCLSVVLSPPFRNHFTAFPLSCHCLSVFLSLPFRCPFTAFPLSFHCLSLYLTACPCLSTAFFSSRSLPFRCPSTALSSSWPADYCAHCPANFHRHGDVPLLHCLRPVTHSSPGRPRRRCAAPRPLRPVCAQPMQSGMQLSAGAAANNWPCGLAAGSSAGSARTLGRARRSGQPSRSGNS